MATHGEADGDPIRELVQLLSRLPGVGEKSARRMVYMLLAGDAAYARALGTRIATVIDQVRRCVSCGVFTGAERCAICRDPRRSDETLCVVARPWDVDALERAGTFRGRYHVLHVLIDPLAGVGPADFPFAQLAARVRAEGTAEVIVATPSTVEGETTALYLAESLRPLDVRVTRIASGIPHGGDLEYADPITLGRALDGRRGI